jgi:hypothetical protein
MQFAVMPGHEDDWAQVLVSLTDITARKKAEAYLEFLGNHDVSPACATAPSMSTKSTASNARKPGP